MQQSAPPLREAEEEWSQALSFTGCICTGHCSIHKAQHDLLLLSVDNVPIIYGLLCLKYGHVSVKATLCSAALFRQLKLKH